MKSPVTIEIVKTEVYAEHEIQLTDGQAKAIAEKVNADTSGLNSVEELIDDALFATQQVYVSCNGCGAETTDLTSEGQFCPCNRGTLRLRIVRDDSKDICSHFGCGQPRSAHPVKLVSGTYGVDGHRFFVHWSEITKAWAATDSARRTR